MLIFCCGSEGAASMKELCSLCSPLKKQTNFLKDPTIVAWIMSVWLIKTVLRNRFLSTASQSHRPELLLAVPTDLKHVLIHRTSLKHPNMTRHRERRAKLYHMLSFTFHDCIFNARKSEEQKKKKPRKSEESGQRRRKKWFFCLCSMDKGLFSHGFLSDIWKTIRVHAKISFVWISRWIFDI